MNYELFIAKRMISVKRGKGTISSPIIKIAIMAVALGTVVMLVTIATSLGLQKKIREKISGFNGHIQIVKYDSNHSNITLQPLSKKQTFYPKFKNISNIKKVQVFATKVGIIRTETDFEGIILKGIDKEYDTSFFDEYLVEGRFPKISGKKSNEVLISKEIANRMHFKIGSEFNTLFIKDNPAKPPWLRVFKVVGIYNTGFKDFDENIMIGDIQHIQKMNRWKKDEVGGFEVILSNFDEINKKNHQIYQQIGSELNSISIVEKYPAIFEWIGLFDNNTYVIIAIMILVAGINVITALLVLILERTQMIGILKSLGNTTKSVQKIFLYNAGYLIVKGLFWGNLIGLLLLGIQKYFGVITLNPETYYVAKAPVYIGLHHILLLNAGTLLLCMLMLLIPSLIIAKITPIKTIKFG